MCAADPRRWSSVNTKTQSETARPLALLIQLVAARFVDQSSLEDVCIDVAGRLLPSGWCVMPAGKVATASEPSDSAKQLQATLLNDFSSKSVERRTLLALHYGKLLRIKDVNSVVTRNERRVAYRDLQLLLSTQALRPPVHSRDSLLGDHTKLEEAVDHMLQSCTTLSWGNKLLVVDGVTCTLPALMRDQIRDRMYIDYTKQVANPIGRTTYYAICGALTSRDKKQRKLQGAVAASCAQLTTLAVTALDAISEVYGHSNFEHMNALVNELAHDMSGDADTVKQTVEDLRQAVHACRDFVKGEWRTMVKQAYVAEQAAQQAASSGSQEGTSAAASVPATRVTGSNDRHDCLCHSPRAAAGMAPHEQVLLQARVSTSTAKELATATGARAKHLERLDSELKKVSQALGSAPYTGPKGICPKCAIIPQLFGRLQLSLAMVPDHLRPNHSDAIALHRRYLRVYLGHHIRAVVQDIGTRALRSDQLPDDGCYIIADWKMSECSASRPVCLVGCV